MYVTNVDSDKNESIIFNIQTLLSITTINKWPLFF